MIFFFDRKPKYPNRVLITPESGTPFYATLTRADEPIVAGTPMNAATLNALQKEIQIESADYPGCYYRMVGDVQEWINPPMVYGISYRTIERHNGKPVFVCTVDISGLTPSGYDEIDLSHVLPEGRVDVIHYEGVVSVNGLDFTKIPHYAGETDYCMPYFNFGEGGLWIEHKGAYDDGLGHLTFKYVMHE